MVANSFKTCKKEILMKKWDVRPVQYLLLAAIVSGHLAHFNLNIRGDFWFLITLTWILCKDSREDSSQSHVGSNFIVLYFLKCKLDHF